MSRTNHVLAAVQVFGLPAHSCYLLWTPAPRGAYSVLSVKKKTARLFLDPCSSWCLFCIVWKKQKPRGAFCALSVKTKTACLFLDPCSSWCFCVLSVTATKTVCLVCVGLNPWWCLFCVVCDVVCDVVWADVCLHVRDEYVTYHHTNHHTRERERERDHTSKLDHTKGCSCTCVHADMPVRVLAVHAAHRSQQLRQGAFLGHLRQRVPFLFVLYLTWRNEAPAS